MSRPVRKEAPAETGREAPGRVYASGMVEESPARVRRVQIVVNPVSGVPARHAAYLRFRAALAAEGVEAVETPTERAGHARALGAEAPGRGIDAVVVAGGDGTVNEVANGLPLDGIPLGVFPTGTSNLLARDLRLPFDPEAAARVLAAGRRRRLDVGTVNGRRFLMVVGIGWDAHVVEAVSARRHGHLGRLRYVRPVLEAVMGYRFPPLRVSFGGNGGARPAVLAFACNTRNYAGWFALAPDAVPDDGVFDFVAVRRGARRDVVRWMWAALTATLPRYREAHLRTGKDLLVTADEPVPYQVDGDPGGTTPVRIGMEPGKIEVIVP